MSRRNEALQGTRYWWQYIDTNGLDLRLSAAGLRRLSRALKLPAPLLRRKINAYIST